MPIRGPDCMPIDNCRCWCKMLWVFSSLRAGHSIHGSGASVQLF
jgi:hypothetical protein